MRARASQLSTDVSVLAYERYSGNANPTGNTALPSRQKATLTSSDPRILNPKVNAVPWSTSYKMTRTEPSSVRRKGGRKRKGKAGDKQ